MKKIALLVLLAFTVSLVGCSPAAVKKAAAEYEKDKYVFLVAGFDDAAENTDVLFTVSYDAKNAEARVAQIPTLILARYKTKSTKYIHQRYLRGRGKKLLLAKPQKKLPPHLVRRSTDFSV